MSACKYCREKSPHYLYRRDETYQTLSLAMAARIGLKVWERLGAVMTVSVPSAGSSSNERYTAIQINYCPMCGRKMREDTL